MNKQHNFKIATDSPTDIAKQILRCESLGTLTCSGSDVSGVTVAVASDLSGAPLIFMPFDSEIEKLLKHEKNTTLQLGGTPSLSISFHFEVKRRIIMCQ